MSTELLLDIVHHAEALGVKTREARVLVDTCAVVAELRDALVADDDAKVERALAKAFDALQHARAEDAGGGDPAAVGHRD